MLLVLWRMDMDNPQIMNRVRKLAQSENNLRAMKANAADSNTSSDARAALLKAIPKQAAIVKRRKVLLAAESAAMQAETAKHVRRSIETAKVGLHDGRVESDTSSSLYGLQTAEGEGVVPPHMRAYLNEATGNVEYQPWPPGAAFAPGENPMHAYLNDETGKVEYRLEPLKPPATTPPSPVQQPEEGEEFMDTKQRISWFPTFRESLAIAAVVALLSFFFIHNYNPTIGFLANIMRADIYFTSPCPYVSPYDTAPAAPPPGCGENVLPYRWILAGLVLFVGFCWYRERRTKS